MPEHIGCENIKRTDHWPFAKKCGATPTKLVEIVVSPAVGMYNQVTERHFVCDPCLNVLENQWKEVT